MPNNSTANVLAKLFGSNKVCSERKRSFDPSSECIVASKKAKKKATNQRIKPKNLNVVLLQQKEEKVPKGKKRATLNASGRIKKLEFKRCMTADEVRATIMNGISNFDAQKIQFLCCGQDNTLIKYETQDLDGDGVIDLAGQGSVYLLQVFLLIIAIAV